MFQIARRTFQIGFAGLLFSCIAGAAVEFGRPKVEKTIYDCKILTESSMIDSFSFEVSERTERLLDGTLKLSQSARLDTAPWKGLNLDNQGYQVVEILRLADQFLISGTLFDGGVETFDLSIVLHTGGEAPSARVSSGWGGYELHMDAEKFVCTESYR